MLAQSSRAIAQTLAQIPDTSNAAVVIPDVPGLPQARMYEVRWIPHVLPWSQGLSTKLLYKMAEFGQHTCLSCHQRDNSNHLTSLCIAQDAKRLPVISWNLQILDLLMMAWVWQVFALAAQCALTGNYLVNLEDCLDLWALAASLQV